MNKNFSPSFVRLSEVPSHVKVLAVTKQRSVAEVLTMVQRHEALLRHGGRLGASGRPLLSFGENRVEGAECRFADLRAALPQFELEFHFLGKLQSRKIKTIASLFDCVQSVETLEQAVLLSRARGEQGGPLSCFLEVNLAQLSQRSGTSFDEVPALYEAVSQLPHLRIIGLMGMAGVGATTTTDLRVQFSTLVQAQQGLHLPECSMGMSEDYLDAIKAGASWLRLGRVLFE